MALVYGMAPVLVGIAATFFAYWRYDFLLWQMRPEDRMRYRQFKVGWFSSWRAYSEFLDSSAPQVLGDPAVTASWWVARVSLPVGVIAFLAMCFFVSVT